MRKSAFVTYMIIGLLILAFSACAPKGDTSGDDTGTPGGTAQGTGTDVRSDGTMPSGDSQSEDTLASAGSGSDIFTSKCATCHMIGDEGGRVGPDLTTVGLRMGEEEIKAMIANPTEVRPDTAMPKIDLSDNELGLLVIFLSNLR